MSNSKLSWDLAMVKWPSKAQIRQIETCLKNSTSISSSKKIPVTDYDSEIIPLWKLSSNSVFFKNQSVHESLDPEDNDDNDDNDDDEEEEEEDAVPSSLLLDVSSSLLLSLDHKHEHLDQNSFSSSSSSSSSSSATSSTGNNSDSPKVIQVKNSFLDSVYDYVFSSPEDYHPVPSSSYRISPTYLQNESDEDYLNPYPEMNRDEPDSSPSLQTNVKPKQQQDQQQEQEQEHESAESCSQYVSNFSKPISYPIHVKRKLQWIDSKDDKNKNRNSSQSIIIMNKRKLERLDRVRQNLNEWKTQQQQKDIVEPKTMMDNNDIVEPEATRTRDLFCPTPRQKKNRLIQQTLKGK